MKLENVFDKNYENVEYLMIAAKKTQ